MFRFLCSSYKKGRFIWWYDLIQTNSSNTKLAGVVLCWKNNQSYLSCFSRLPSRKAGVPGYKLRKPTDPNEIWTSFHNSRGSDNKIPGTHKKETAKIVRMFKTSTVSLITEEICTKRNQDLMIRMKRNCQDKPSKIISIIFYFCHYKSCWNGRKLFQWITSPDWTKLSLNLQLHLRS